MTTTRFTGKCVRCGTHYTSDVDTMTCGCAASQGKPVSWIKWKIIRHKISSKKCSDACTSAKSDNCVCECDGQNHGKDLG